MLPSENGAHRNWQQLAVSKLLTEKNNKDETFKQTKNKTESQSIITVKTCEKNKHSLERTSEMLICSDTAANVTVTENISNSILEFL